jgi:hypothetical protein
MRYCPLNSNTHETGHYTQAATLHTPWHCKFLEDTIVRDGLAMVNHLHALPADATDHQTLQQRGTLTRRALATLGAEGMRIRLKLSLVLWYSSQEM